jgi:hypothetical protein
VSFSYDFNGDGVYEVSNSANPSAAEREEQFRRVGRRYPGDADYVMNVRRQNP